MHKTCFHLFLSSSSSSNRSQSYNAWLLMTTKLWDNLTWPRRGAPDSRREMLARQMCHQVGGVSHRQGANYARMPTWHGNHHNFPPPPRSLGPVCELIFILKDSLQIAAVSIAIFFCLRHWLFWCFCFRIVTAHFHIAIERERLCWLTRS